MDKLEILMIYVSEWDRRNSYAKCMNFSEMSFGGMHFSYLETFKDVSQRTFLWSICGSLWCLRHLKLPDK